MKIVIDTNVFVSGVFFSGPPYQILRAWRDGKIQWVISKEILEEYQRVGEKLADRFPGVELTPVLELLAIRGRVIIASSLPEPVCDDPDDDKFLSCALADGCKVIVSGDKHLLKASGYHGITVVRPRRFIEEFL